jgi:hypothetical protein
MSYLPDRFERSGIERFSPTGLPATRRRAEKAVVTHAVERWARDTMLDGDLRSSTAAVLSATDQQLEVLAKGLSRVTNEVGLEILATSLRKLNKIHERLIEEEFG